MGQIEPILQNRIPDAQRAAAAAPLPRMRPVEGSWLTHDDAFVAQLAEKARLLSTRRAAILAMLPEAEDACAEALDAVCAERGIRPTPDMARDPLAAVSTLIQEDICILQKQGPAHVLVAALLAFPAGWTLSEKLGHPLMRIHAPVASYDDGIGARVQRFFDGVRPGRPLWRANMLRYDNPALYQPRKEADPVRFDHDAGQFERSERQTVLRLPKTGAVVFAIHTSVVRRG